MECAEEDRLCGRRCAIFHDCSVTADASIIQDNVPPWFDHHVAARGAQYWLANVSSFHRSSSSFRRSSPCHQYRLRHHHHKPQATISVLPSPAILVLSFLMDSTRLSLVVGFLNPQILSSLTHDRRLYGICLFRRACF